MNQAGLIALALFIVAIIGVITWYAFWRFAKWYYWPKELRERQAGNRGGAAAGSADSE